MSRSAVLLTPVLPSTVIAKPGSGRSAEERGVLTRVGGGLGRVLSRGAGKCLRLGLRPGSQTSAGDAGGTCERQGIPLAGSTGKRSIWERDTGRGWSPSNSSPHSRAFAASPSKAHSDRPVSPPPLLHGDRSAAPAEAWGEGNAQPPRARTRSGMCLKHVCSDGRRVDSGFPWGDWGLRPPCRSTSVRWKHPSRRGEWRLTPTRPQPFFSTCFSRLTLFTLISYSPHTFYHKNLDTLETQKSQRILFFFIFFSVLPSLPS